MCTKDFNIPSKWSSMLTDIYTIHLLYNSMELYCILYTCLWASKSH